MPSANESASPSRQASERGSPSTLRRTASNSGKNEPSVMVKAPHTCHVSTPAFAAASSAAPRRFSSNTRSPPPVMVVTGSPESSVSPAGTSAFAHASVPGPAHNSCKSTRTSPSREKVSERVSGTSRSPSLEGK